MFNVDLGRRPRGVSLNDASANARLDALLTRILTLILFQRTCRTLSVRSEAKSRPCNFALCNSAAFRQMNACSSCDVSAHFSKGFPGQRVADFVSFECVLVAVYVFGIIISFGASAKVDMAGKSYSYYIRMRTLNFFCEPL